MDKLVELLPGKQAHASGALWLPHCETAFLADVHLGYGWAMRRRGHLGPVTDGGVAERLQSLIDELQPKRLVLLGDAVHAPKPGWEERLLVENTLTALRARCELLVVRGNHDRGFAKDFPALGIPVVEHWQEDDVLAIHGDIEPPATPHLLVLGHHHPAYGIRDAAGVKQKVPVFLATRRAFILPAFSPFAAGLDVARGLTKDLRAVLGPQRVTIVAATGRRAMRLPHALSA